ncbi:hypothetical protein YPPY55_0668, partial [Yersinia pestis PY-55]
MMPAEDRKNG